jgi:hypothetical protein
MDPQQSTTAVASPTDNQQFRKQTTRKLVGDRECFAGGRVVFSQVHRTRRYTHSGDRAEVSSLECRLGAVALLATSRGKARSRHASYVTRRIMRSDGSQHGFDERH